MARQATLPLFEKIPALPEIGGLDPALEPWLRRALLRKEPMALGLDGADPYSPEQDRPAFVRALLEAFTQMEGLEIFITTRSPRVLQDLALLAELDQRHMVRVDVPLASVDAEAALKIEPREPEPEARLWAVSRLASEGIATRVVIKPLVSGINDGEDSLRALFEAALEAGACDVILEAAPAAKARFFPWPARKQESEPEALLATIRRLRLEHGFPRSTPGRG